MAGRKIEIRLVGDSSHLRRELAKAGASVNTFGSGVGRTLRRGALAGGAALAGLTVLSAKAAIEFESSFAGIRKTVDATEPQFESLEKSIRKMAKEIPTAVNDLNKIGESAGQLGISRKALLGFIRTVADLGETTNLVGEEASAGLAKIANVTGMKQTNENFKRLGSTIVELGNKGASTEADIVAMGLRIAATGRMVGLSVPQILGLANAMSSLGIEAEAGGSAISQTFSKMQSAVGAGGSKLEAFGKAAGVTGAEFKRAFQDDASGALVLFLGGLKKVIDSGGDVQGFLQNLGLGGLRVADTLKRMSQNQKLVTDSVNDGNKAWAENTALTKEAEKRYETTASQLKLLRNRWTDLKITIGEKLLPVLNDAIKGIVQFAEKVGAQPTLKLKLKVIWDAISVNAADLWAKIKHEIVVAFQGEERRVQVREGVEIQIVKPKVTISGADIKAALGKFWSELKTQMFDEDASTQTMTKAWGDALKAKIKKEISQIPGDLARDFRAALNAQDISRDLQNWIVNPLRGLAPKVAILGGGLTFALSRGWLSGSSGIVGLVTQTAQSIVRTFTQRIPAAFSAAVQLGSRVVSGIKSGLSRLQGTVTAMLSTVASAIANVASAAFGWAASIGSSIIRGVVSGLSGLAGQVGSAIKSGIERGIALAGGLLRGSGDFMFTIHKVGKPLAEGVIRGWLLGTATLPDKMSETLQKAIDRARGVIERARTSFASAFEGMSARILRAFDAQSSAHETASEQRLREIDERRQMEDLIERQADAQERLNAAIASGNQAEISSATRDVQRAGEDIEAADLQKKAEAERREYDSSREELRLQLEKRLGVMQEHWAKVGVNAQKALGELNKLMLKFGVNDFSAAGEEIGTAFVNALQKAIKNATKAAGGLKVTISAEVEGLGKIGKRAEGGPVSAGSAYVVGEKGPELFRPGRSGAITPNAALAGAGGTIVVNFNGHVSDKRQFEELVRSTLIRTKNRQGGTGVS